jgi:hypothetical protein
MIPAELRELPLMITTMTGFDLILMVWIISPIAFATALRGILRVSSP